MGKKQDGRQGMQHSQLSKREYSPEGEALSVFGGLQPNTHGHPTTEVGESMAQNDMTNKRQQQKERDPKILMTVKWSLE